eukprot:Rhum_TRINITY_DN16474_c0_g1::Rhum_TRINITY_DN16474_c0_g1_i1::g.163281::m.163281/K02892/RP-L23, MRPL23, rplW; large subunit ribosomal protein L23
MNTLSRRAAGAPLNRFNTALRSQRCNVSYANIWQPGSPNIGTSYHRPVSHLKQKFVNKAKLRTAQPTAITHSKANFGSDKDFNFPDYSIVLEIHSVLYPTTLVVFRTPPQLSETEVQMYLQNVYGINTIKEINLQYRRGERWMDTFGRRWKHPDYNRAYVYLAEPVEVNLKVNK